MISDARIQEHAQAVIINLETDVGDFTLFDSSFSTANIGGLITQVDAIQSLNIDDVVIDEMVERTDLVLDKMAECNTAYRTVSFFVKKAFKGNRGIINQFGANDIAKVRQNQAEMILFMKSLSNVAEQYRTPLLDAGINPEVIDSLPLLHSQLLTVNNDQEIFKKKRGKLAQDRVIALNELYLSLRSISDMAKIIYADNPAQLAKYLIPYPKSSTDEEDDLMIS